MQFKVVALAAFAASAAAWSNGTVYTTEVLTAYTTVCPAATSFSINGVTYTVTESTTLTITNCPCTIVKPVTTSSVVATSAPVYANTTTTAAATKSVGTTSVKTSATTTPSTITTSGGNKAFALSGASLVGLLGLAAYVL